MRPYNMTCSDYEESIFLWREIGENKQNELLLHMESCGKCKQLFEEVQAMQRLTDAAALQQAVIPHAAKLTGQIMEKIQASKVQHSTRFQFGPWWALNLYRLASLAFALSIVIAFSIEYFSTNPVLEIKNQSSSKSVILQGRLFKEKLIKSNSDVSESKLCNAEFLSNEAYIQCVRKNLQIPVN